MSVWSTAVSPEVPLVGAEGDLVSVSVLVEPPRLEALLDALAHLEFPLNPQIYHNGGPTGLPATTVVEFPAYANWLPEIRRLLEASGFPAGSVETAGMLDSIHAGHAAAAS